MVGPGCPKTLLELALGRQPMGLGAREGALLAGEEGWTGTHACGAARQWG